MTRQTDFFQESLTGAVGQDIFDQEGDMSQVERGYLADRLDDFVMNGLGWDNDYNRMKINDRFRKCGQQGSRFGCPDCRSQFYIRFFCKFKLCDRCARIYGKALRDRMLDLLRPCFSKRRKGWTIAMITLSTSTSKYGGNYPSRTQYKNFNRQVAAFCRLFYGKYEGYWTRTGKVAQRRKKFLGAGTFSVNEFGEDNNNLHCHILLYGPWVLHSTLLENWIRISGGDRGCHIQPIRNPDIAAAYVTKYLTKPPRFLDTEKAVDFVQATRHTRRIRTGGIFYNQLKQPGASELLLCPYCAELLDYNGLCRLGNEPGLVDLRYARKHRDKWIADKRVENFLAYLPEGATAVDQPFWQERASDCQVSSWDSTIKHLFA